MLNIKIFLIAKKKENSRFFEKNFLVFHLYILAVFIYFVFSIKTVHWFFICIF